MSELGSSHVPTLRTTHMAVSIIGEGAFFGVPKQMTPYFLGSILGPLIFGNSLSEAGKWPFTDCYASLRALVQAACSLSEYNVRAFFSMALAYPKAQNNKKALWYVMCSLSPKTSRCEFLEP